MLEPDKDCLGNSKGRNGGGGGGGESYSVN